MSTVVFPKTAVMAAPRPEIAVPEDAGKEDGAQEGHESKEVLHN